MQITAEQLGASQSQAMMGTYPTPQRSQSSWIAALFLLIVLTVIGSLIYKTVSWMSDEQAMPLSSFVLEGDLAFVSQQEVHDQLVTLSPLGTFMTQDVNQLQRAVESLPWVNRASIRKQWPDTIKIYVVEHRAAAIWNGNALLNQTGVVFDADVTRLDTPEVVKLYGPSDTPSLVLDTYREIEPRFEALGLSIDSLVLNDRLAWQIILDNGIRLELGTDALEERLQRFVALYRTMGDMVEQISYIDLRYDTGAAVGWMPQSSTSEESDND